MREKITFSDLRRSPQKGPHPSILSAMLNPLDFLSETHRRQIGAVRDARLFVHLLLIIVNHYAPLGCHWSYVEAFLPFVLFSSHWAFDRISARDRSSSKRAIINNDWKSIHLPTITWITRSYERMKLRYRVASYKPLIFHAGVLNSSRCTACSYATVSHVYCSRDSFSATFSAFQHRNEIVQVEVRCHRLVLVSSMTKCQDLYNLRSRPSYLEGEPNVSASTAWSAGESQFLHSLLYLIAMVSYRSLLSSWTIVFLLASAEFFQQNREREREGRGEAILWAFLWNFTREVVAVARDASSAAVSSARGPDIPSIVQPRVQGDAALAGLGTLHGGRSVRLSQIYFAR